MAMVTRSKGSSPTFGASSGSSDSDDSKDKFLIAYTRGRAKSETKDNPESETTKVVDKTPKKAATKTAGKKKTPAKKNSRGKESETRETESGTGESESRERETESGETESGVKETESRESESMMSGVAPEAGDNDSSSSGSSSSASSSNRSTPNQELENAAKEEDNKSESGDSKSESGDSSSDSKSESGDSKSESGDSKSESGDSVDNSEKVENSENKEMEQPPVAMETENKSDETKVKSVDKTSAKESESKSSPAKIKIPMKSPPLKGKNIDDKSPKEDSGEREYIIRTRAGRGQTSSPPTTPTDSQPPLSATTPGSETKKISPKSFGQRQTSSESKTPPKSSVSPGIKKRTPVKFPRNISVEGSSVSSADYHGNSSNDSSSLSGVWRRRQTTPTTTEGATEDSEGQHVVEEIEGKRRLSVTNPDGQKTEKDYFCWVCHKEGPVPTWVACQLCPRTYHTKCLNVETVSDIDWVCPECERVLRAECTDTQSKAMSMLSIDQLCITLKFALTRMKHASSEPFLRPVDTLQVPNYLDFIFNPMDLGTLEKNIKKKMYGSTEAFLADAKWILHNCVVFNGLHHKLTSGAKTIVKICRHEMSEIEVCPDCYMNAAYARNENWFCDPCRFPHTLVWAKLKGYPFWPAKALREENGHIDCRFFGAHDRAWVQINQVYLLSKDVPTQMKKSKAGFEESLEELSIHIQKLKEKFGDFHYFPPKTLYKELEAFAALSPKKDFKSSPEKSSQNEQDAKSFTLSPSKSVPSRYAGANVFTTLARELDSSMSPTKGPFASLARSEKSNGRSANAKEGVFTISDSALAETSPLTLPSLNRSFATKAKMADKNMLDEIMKKLQSDEEEPQSDSEEKKQSPKAKESLTEKMDCSDEKKFEKTSKNGAGNASEKENEDSEKDQDKLEEDMEVDAEPSVMASSSAPLPQNLKPNPFLESLVNSCKKKLGVDSVKDLKELSSDESGDEDNSSSSSSSVGSSSEDEADEESDGDKNGQKKKSESSKKIEAKTESEELKPEISGETSEMKPASEAELDAKPPQKDIGSETETTKKTNSEDKSTEVKLTKDKSEDKLAVENNREDTSDKSKPVDNAAKSSESILMQFLISSTTGQGQTQGQTQGQGQGQTQGKGQEQCQGLVQGQKRQNDDESSAPASAAKKLRPTSPPVNLPCSAAAAGPISSSCLDNKDGSPAPNTYGFSVDKYFQKAMGGLKEVFGEMAADILTQGANNVVTRHLQREIEQMKWKHEQDCQELRHNAELTLAEMRMSWELERDRAVKEVRQQCTKTKDKAIEDAKKRQWCAQCGKEAMFYCCWNTSYCDYPCQQRHWPLHMNYCTQTQGNQSQDGNGGQSQLTNASHDLSASKSASSTTLSAQALTEQVQRAIQSNNSAVGAKKIQLAQGKFKTVPQQVAVSIPGSQKNMVYAVQMPTGQSVNISPVVQQTSGNSLIKNPGNAGFQPQK